MKAPELIVLLAQSGGALRLEEDQLVFDGPAELLQHHREAIAALRPQLVDLLTPPPCSCETIDGWFYRCELHQDTPAGKVLVEPADAQHTDLVEKATALFGGRALEARR